MRICIVTHKLQKGDGQGRVNYEIAWEALRKGHEVILVASYVDDALANHSNIEVVCISVASWPTELLKNIVFSMASACWLNQNRLSFDILLVNGAITQARADFNAVHFVHSSWLNSPVHASKGKQNLYGLYQWLYTRLNVAFEKKAFRQSDCMIAVSEQVSRELELIGISPQSIKTIVNGVDLAEFSPGSVDRRSLGLPNSVPLALFVGDIRTPRKNLDTVLSALVEVPDLALAIVGSTDNSPYPQMAKDLGVAHRTHFLGYRKDMPALMRAADFFVFPSRYDPFGLALLEAMATGLAVVTAKSAGASSLVTPEVGFVLEQANDKVALANAMIALTADGNLRQLMGNRARKVAEALSWQSMAQGYIRLFEDFSAVKSG